VVKRGKKT